MMFSCLAVAMMLSYCNGESFRIDPRTNNFVDAAGRVRIFHGVNIVHKLHPYHPILEGEMDVNSTLVEADMKNLKKYGMNVVRLGVMWPGVEPTRGEYNQTYLDTMYKIVEDLGNHGIHTILDFHQDLLHGDYCGEGVPDYVNDMLKPGMSDKCGDTRLGAMLRVMGVCKSFKQDYKFNADPVTGYPVIDQCLQQVFALYYTSPELNYVYDKLYTDSAVQERMAMYFAKVAETFAKSQFVLGYDLFNEPFPGNMYEKPWLLKGGKADKDHLQPLYEKLHVAIREHDDRKILFYEPAPFPGTVPTNGGIVNPVGFTSAPGGKKFDDRNALSYHVYCCAAGEKNCNHDTGDVVTSKNGECDNYVERVYDQRVKDYKRIGGGGFLTEFGACSNTQNCVNEITRVTSNADKHYQSWAYWQYKYNEDITTTSGSKQGFYHDNGTLQKKKVSALARPYATAVAGKPLLMRFSPFTNVFQLTYRTLRSVESKKTNIYASKELTYPYGYDAIVKSNIKVKTLQTATTFSIQHSGLEKADIQVVLIPKVEKPVKTFKVHGVKAFVAIKESNSTSIQIESKSKKFNNARVTLYDENNTKMCRGHIGSSSAGKVSFACSPLQPENLIFNYKLEVRVKGSWFSSTTIDFTAAELGNIYGKQVLVKII